MKNNNSKKERLTDRKFRITIKADTINTATRKHNDQRKRANNPDWRGD